MVSSKLDIISKKLETHLEDRYWKGAGTRDSLKEDINQFVEKGIVTKQEQDYYLKNERRVLTKIQLIHALPELHTKEIMETTLKHLAHVMVKKGQFSKKYDEEMLINEAKNHIIDTYKEKIESVNDGFRVLKKQIKASSELTKDIPKVLAILEEIRDLLLETGKALAMHKVNRLSSKLELAMKSTNPKNRLSKNDLLDEVINLEKNI